MSLKRNLKNCISVAYSLIRFSLIKVCMPSRISYRVVERVSPNVMIEITKNSQLILGNRVRVHRGSKLSANRGTLEIGDNVAINQNCGIYAMEHIEIGTGTEFGPGVLVYDHDHDFRCEGGLKAGNYKTAPVVIGNNVWIGANSIILRGTVIGDNSVIGAGTIVTGVIPPNSIVTQKRENLIRKF